MSGAYPELHPRRITPARVIYRFLLGRPLDGIRRTDATFLRPGRHSMDPSGYASRWSYLAGWQRLILRLVGLYVLIVSLFTWVLGPGVLLTQVLWAGVLGSGPAAVLWIRAYGVRVPGTSIEVLGRRTWVRTYVRPVAAAVDSVLGTSHHKREAVKWVRVPRTFRNSDGDPVVVSLPGSFTGSDEGTKRRLVSAVGNRLGMRDPSVSWDLEGDRPRVLISCPPVPPERVSYADVSGVLTDLPEYEVLLGLAARRAPLTAHLVGESPHIAVSAGPGAGKSEHIKVLIMQALRWGWGVVILDWKEVSHGWADGLPGVLYVRDIAAIHDTCVRLGEEVDVRKALYRTDRDMPGKAKVLVVAEEMNVTADLLMAYWQDLRSTAEPEEKRAMPLKSPALRGLQAVNFGGRQFSMFMIFVAQRFSARVTNGNADLRESFQIRLLARSTKQTQTMLAPQIKPFPKTGVAPGRWVAVIGQDAVVYQAPLITDEQARDFALGGQDNPTSPLAGAHQVAPSQRSDLGDSLPAQVTAGSRDIDHRKLSDMVDALEPLGVSLKVLRLAAGSDANGDPDFPAPVGGSANRGYTYDCAEVQQWARRRHARKAIR